MLQEGDLNKKRPLYIKAKEKRDHAITKLESTQYVPEYIFLLPYSLPHIQAQYRIRIVLLNSVQDV